MAARPFCYRDRQYETSLWRPVYFATETGSLRCRCGGPSILLQRQADVVVAARPFCYRDRQYEASLRWSVHFAKDTGSMRRRCGGPSILLQRQAV